MDELLEFQVRLLIDVKTIMHSFPRGSIQTVVSPTRGRLHIKGYPATTLISSAWEPVFNWEEVFR